MNEVPNLDRSRAWVRWAARTLLMAGIWPAWSGVSLAELPPVPGTETPKVDHAVVRAEGAAVKTTATPSHVDPAVVQAACSTCSGLLGSLGSPGSPGGLPPTGQGFGTPGPGNCGGCCYPGRDSCCDCCSDNCLGNFLCGIYKCICGPDPCYEPSWIAAANNAFFVDSPRPVTQTTLRWDNAWDITRADRAEYLFARFRAGASPGAGVAGIPRSIDVHELNSIMEVGTNKFSVAVSVPYRHLEFNDPITTPPLGSQSGFADMNIATKSVLLDCELLLLTFGFKTTIPTGSPTQGLGIGHVALEPSLIWALKLTPDTYFQGQLAYWIPIAGDREFQGNIFHCHGSLNHVLCRPLTNIQIIGSLEANEWTVINGNYTVTDGLAADGSPLIARAENSMFSTGAGVRAVICNKIDFGVGSAFSLTGNRWAEEVIRAEFRWRF